MGYLKEFKEHIENNDFPSTKNLWEEFCTCEDADLLELKDILESLKTAPFFKEFGEIVELIIPLWNLIKDQNSELAQKTIALIYDIQTTNSSQLANLAIELLKQYYPEDSFFKEKLRLIGLRQKKDFQGAISNYALLSHMNKGKFVFHTGGLGTGEILELSLIREQLVIEFETTTEPKNVSFENAFKYLKPLSSDHFLSRRFGNPDKLEEEAKKNPEQLIIDLLQDLGPKNAAEIKEELHELVIPAKDWSKWWQTTRSKIKKNTLIAEPKSIKTPFQLRKQNVSHNESFLTALNNTKKSSSLLEIIRSYSRDFPEIFTDLHIKTQTTEVLKNIISENNSISEKIESLLLIQVIEKNTKNENTILDLLHSTSELGNTINHINSTSLRKKALQIIKDHFSNWKDLFLKLLFSVNHPLLKEFIFTSLTAENNETPKIIELIIKQKKASPSTFFWYLQKILKDPKAPYADDKNKKHFLEKSLLLLNYIEQIREHKDLSKKLLNTLTKNRYLNIRETFKNASVEYLQEFILLASKCISLTDHDKQILASLAEVANPKMKDLKPSLKEEKEDIIWTTQKGYDKIKNRMEQIATVETVENAQEIEAARALGDLRENSEYKFALEKRSRLQGELALLSKQIKKARILTKSDISTDTAGVGTIVTLKKENDETIQYTIIGPFDADTEKNILSINSKLAESISGKKENDSFSFQNETFKIEKIESFL